MALNLGQVLPFKSKHNVCNSESRANTFAPMESIRERRERLGYTQKELADACGKHFSHICHIERGRADPSFKVIVKLAAALDMTPGKLVDMLVRSSKSGKSSASVTDIQRERERRKRR